MPTILDLPAELVGRIGSHAEHEDLLSLHATTRWVSQSSFDAFTERFFKRRSHICTIHSLRILLEISRVPALARSIRKVEFIVLKDRNRRHAHFSDAAAGNFAIIENILDELVRFGRLTHVKVSNDIPPPLSVADYGGYGMATLLRDFSAIMNAHFYDLEGIKIGRAAAAVNRTIARTGYHLQCLNLGYRDEMQHTGTVRAFALGSTGGAWSNLTKLKMGFAKKDTHSLDGLKALVSTATSLKVLYLYQAAGAILDVFTKNLPSSSKVESVRLEETRLLDHILVDFLRKFTATLVRLELDNVLLKGISASRSANERVWTRVAEFLEESFKLDSLEVVSLEQHIPLNQHSVVSQRLTLGEGKGSIYEVAYGRQEVKKLLKELQGAGTL